MNGEQAGNIEYGEMQGMLASRRRYRCEVCGQPKDAPCMDTTVRKGQKPRQLPRGEHLARVLPPGSSKAKEPPNEMFEGRR